MSSLLGINYDAEWQLIQKVFPILSKDFKLPYENDFTKDELYQVINTAHTLKITKILEALIIRNIENYTSSKIAPKFWAYFEPHEGFNNFINAVEHLYDFYKQLLVHMNNLDMMRKKNQHNDPVKGQDNLKDALKLIIRSALLSQLPVGKKEIIRDFYEIALKMEVRCDFHDAEVICKGCGNNTRECCCSKNFYQTNRKLLELGLMEPLVSQILTSLIYTHTEEQIEQKCKGSFDQSYLEQIEFMNKVILNWVKKIYCSDLSALSSDCVEAFHKKLKQYMYETYCKVRINQLFNIIIEYPDSIPALEDLRFCLSNTDLKPYLTKKLQTSMETRLLHPGVSTPDILTAYIAAIRSMKVLDPSGLLLETVTQPVHQYLRSREDTIRCVVSSLTEEGPNDLAEELVRAEGIQTDENIQSDEDAENWETWVPDPIDADPLKSLPSRRTSDIISMLVNVYGSKELFVNEYRTLLADRLLTQLSCDTEKEIRYLELLKLRFGDSQLHFCEVMLKDVADSKRINQHIKQDEQYSEDEVSMSAMVLSAQFWPAFKEEKLEIPPQVKAQMESYTKAFETLKGNRTLSWKNHLGTVDLEIELPDRVLNVSVSPVHATIILHFQNKGQWHLDELSRIMQVPATVLRKKMTLWQSHGLIHETTHDIFELVEDRKDEHICQSAEIIEDFEAESAMASAQDQREEEMQTFWSYIVGMLQNLDTLPLERIHQMLKMFAFQGPTQEHSMQELREFLDRKVREHQLIFSGGLYRLPL